MLRFEQISMHFGGVVAVDNCSFEIPSGQITGLIGPNGAGKTTAFNVIAGHLIPNAGKVLLDNLDITHFPPHRRQSLGLSRTFQLPHEFARMTVLENMLVAASNPQGENVLNAVFRPWLGRDVDRASHELVLQTLEFLEIHHVKNEFAGNLSGGQKKLLELGRALMQKPKLILLDEIGAGVNRTLLNKIADKIEQLNRTEGYTFCLIEHDLDYVSRLCSEVVVMAEGRHLMSGSVDEVRNDERVVEVYFGGGKYEQSL